ncbi:Cytochrome c oxidase assembly protein COX19 [Penicillium atrosanguineum]|uniref:Cytochrome c oxidase assembly protein COX19 n=1 Tax=Penicillium atrosanguineum TaxID=1132637 RepID=A0A9W9U378_9EURO|nr:uncharacterized protein N7443_009779 [Penicillium atrosanguineum]KAJ5131856.1 Cytochrome c oxidase assembly protein COX19 [Penicillium atrosanguineum]KAJ5137935.1 Cytochrome c oxidase assembly protein COX19 [Penicillium atrosanguineum]KAJ5289526.1 hypothetical protein N7443_009779 [Penicillium atrosanguineum]KAJ5307341.1 Cytochrome c oxidase assembly protein COX19 [Penicillium atrosanguineum]
MSFGAPGGGSINYKPSPPERGSFPLDHEGAQFDSDGSCGECKHIISGYLKCIKSNRGTNDEACRRLAKDYLACRMDKNLMAPDNFENLGLIFKEDQEKNKTATKEPTQGTEQKK